MKFHKVTTPVHESETILPTRATKDSAGYDFYIKEAITLAPGQTHITFTDVKAQIDSGYVLEIYPRSGLATKHGAVLANSVGIIDADYYNNPDNDGNIGIALFNRSDKVITLDVGERVAQGKFSRYYVTDDDAVDGVRTGGFGSTNEKESVESE